MLDRLRSQSVPRLFLLVSIAAALLPITVIAIHLYESAWEDSWREIREKHQVLAQNLSLPLSTYVNSNRDSLAMLADTLIMDGRIDRQSARQLLLRSKKRMNSFAMLILLDMNGNLITHSLDTNDIPADAFAEDESYLKTRDAIGWTVSGVRVNQLTNQPAIFMGQPILNRLGDKVAILLAELRLDYIEQIRSQVRFGKKGHSAIVDQHGKVLAHPNPEWMQEIRDLSNLPIVKLMMSGKTGVTEFYSPFIKENMVAGYTAVPEIGWGIMVPQPQSEVEARVNTLMRSHLVWGIAGLLLAIFLAVITARWITRPLNKLARDSQTLLDNKLLGKLPAIEKGAPLDVQQLGTTIHSLVNTLQSSREETQDLNDTLQQRVDEATLQLRETNAQLEKIARTDPLTRLANRHHFELSLSNTLGRRIGDDEHICMMLIDIDHFKQINDSCSHAAGDLVLSHVAGILDRSMRQGDLVARYGGDEFVAYMRCTKEVGIERAKEIRDAIKQSALTWEDKSIHITASIGLHCQLLTESLNINDLLDKADRAMYEAKQQGRNRVVNRGH